MRHLFGSVCVAGVLFLAGCGKEETSAPAPTAAPAAAAAPAHSDGYLGTLVKGQQVAVKGIDTAALNQEVTLFNAQEGRLPKDLNELVTMHYLGKLPEPPAGMKINYDATTGKVTVAPK